MSALEAIGGIESLSSQAALAPAHQQVVADVQAAPKGQDFGELISQGLAGVERRIDDANRLVRAFALDDSVPLHEVTIALEEARLAVELASTIRARIVESYREIMNTQL